MALGSDISGVSDISPTLAVATGRQALSEQLLGWLIQPRGGNREAPDRGFDLRGAIGSAMPVSLIEQRVLEQVEAEEEVEQASCDATLLNGKLYVRIRVVDGEGPFFLTVTADALTVDLLLEES